MEKKIVIGVSVLAAFGIGYVVANKLSNSGSIPNGITITNIDKKNSEFDVVVSYGGQIQVASGVKRGETNLLTPLDSKSKYFFKIQSEGSKSFVVVEDVETRKTVLEKIIDWNKI